MTPIFPMSITEIEQRIEKLSVDIEQQRQVLKRLETDKSLAQRHLNDMRDPMARLPLEISSKIFILCLPLIPEPGASHIPMLFLNICNNWTDIALATPTLWKAIHVLFPRAKGFEKALEAWLHRACNQPLSISFRGDFDDTVAAVVRGHARRLEHLEICHCRDEGNHNDPVDPLKGLGSEPFPSLRSLSVGNDTNIRVCFDIPSLLRVLHLAPNIREWSFSKVTISTDRGHQTTLIHRHLRQLRFEDTAHCTKLLQYLALPGLRTISVPFFNMHHDEFCSFLEQSAPPLQNMAMGSYKLHFPELEKCLRLAPTLTHLELNAPSRGLVQDLFAALAESPFGFHPNLHSLSIFEYWGTISDMWREVHHALAVGGTHFTCFNFVTSIHFINYRGVNALQLCKPDAEICAAFRQLVADGREIYIGTEGSQVNLIS
ncbi:hypothetical protein B0H11DRAFT_2040334 [Mycena galericulata]|nr:hypothetical protein B0H11DRAFT_2040334 [Mycena galericulata]